MSVTKAGVGYSSSVDSYRAGKEAAGKAIDQAQITQCDLVLLLATSDYDPFQLRDGVRAVIENQTALVGASSLGVITQENLGYESPHVAVAVFRSDTIRTNIFLEKNLVNREYEAGSSLFKQIWSGNNEPQKMLLFFDLVKEAGYGGVLRNSANAFLDGMTRDVKNWPPFSGAGLIGDLKDRPATQWFHNEVEQQSAVALTFSGPMRVDTVLLHGCRPSSDYHTVTKMEGNALLEIDERPAMDVIAELAGPELGDEWMNTPFLVILGVNQGDRYGMFREEDYAITFVMDVDPTRKALLIFGSELRVGSVIQLMRRKIDFDQVRQRAQDLLQRLGNYRPFLATYIDCAARTAVIGNTDREEAEEIQAIIGSKMPLIGIYSGCEFANLSGRPHALTFTGVLSVLSE